MTSITLQELMSREATRDEIVRVLGDVVELEIAQSSGASGLAMRRAYARIKTRRPELLVRLVADLLDDWLQACAPEHAFPRELWDDPGGLTRYIEVHRHDLGERLLEVIERRLQRSRNRWAQAARALLPRRAIRDAVPRIGHAVERVLATPWSVQSV